MPISTANFRVFAIFAVLLMPSFVSAQAFVEHISPPVIERGKSTRVTFVGRELAGALDVWHSLSAGAIKAKPVESASEKAIFDITVAAEAPVGIFGMRVATRDGLSNVHLFLIDDLPVKNVDTWRLRDPAHLTLPVAIWGTFREAEIDRFAIDVKAGQRVSFEIVGSRFGKDADPLLTIRDAHGKLIVERDNDPGLFYDFRFEHAFTEAGTYTVELRDSRFRGSEHQPYVLRMGRFLAGRVALPNAVRDGRNELRLPEFNGPAIPFELALDSKMGTGTSKTRSQSPFSGPFTGNLRRAEDEGSTWLPLTTTDGEITVAHERDENREKAQALSTSYATTLAFNLSPLRVNPFNSVDVLLPTGRAQATMSKLPGVLCGVLRQPGERHAFLFELAKGQAIYIRGESQALNSPAELDLVLTSHVGRELRRANEVRGEVTLDFTAPAPGFYGLMVRDALRDGGDAFTYRITVRDKPFSPVIIAEVEGLTIPQGSYQPIPLTITRTGTTGPIKLKLLGDPSGRLKITPDEIGEKDNAIVCKLEAEPGLPLGIHAIQILAETSTGPVLVKTQPMIDKQIINVDLIPHGLREDQKRLPPSLTDRLAVLITPPSPFTMELPELLIALPRYQHVDIPIITTRQGFDGPITFTAKGGQLANKKEGRTRVYAEFPEATAKQPNVNGSVHSKILSNVGKSRIEVSGSGVHEGRRITLTRTFELNLVPAYTISAEPVKVSLLPGESEKVRLLANRVKTFDSEVTLHLSPIPGMNFPETVIIPKGQTGIDIEFKAAADAMPRKQNLQINASATVNGYEEDQRGGPFEIEIRKVEVPKKK